MADLSGLLCLETIDQRFQTAGGSDGEEEEDPESVFAPMDDVSGLQDHDKEVPESSSSFGKFSNAHNDLRWRSSSGWCKARARCSTAGSFTSTSRPACATLLLSDSKDSTTPLPTF